MLDGVGRPIPHFDIAYVPGVIDFNIVVVGVFDPGGAGQFTADVHAPRDGNAQLRNDGISIAGAAGAALITIDVIAVVTGLAFGDDAITTSRLGAIAVAPVAVAVVAVVTDFDALMNGPVSATGHSAG